MTDHKIISYNSHCSITVLVAAHACSSHDCKIWQYCVTWWSGVCCQAVIHIHAWCPCCCKLDKSDTISLVFPLFEHANTAYVLRSYSISCSHHWVTMCWWYPYLIAWCLIIFAGNILDDPSPVNTIHDLLEIYDMMGCIAWVSIFCTISIVSNISFTTP